MFTWWQESKIYFAQLTPLTQHYLWIPATQLVSERLINSAGNAVSLRRENLIEWNMLKNLYFYMEDFQIHLIYTWYLCFSFLTMIYECIKYRITGVFLCQFSGSTSAKKIISIETHSSKSVLYLVTYFFSESF